MCGLPMGTVTRKRKNALIEFYSIFAKSHDFCRSRLEISTQKGCGLCKPHPNMGSPVQRVGVPGQRVSIPGTGLPSPGIGNKKSSILYSFMYQDINKDRM